MRFEYTISIVSLLKPRTEYSSLARWSRYCYDRLPVHTALFHVSLTSRVLLSSSGSDRSRSPSRHSSTTTGCFGTDGHNALPARCPCGGLDASNTAEVS